MIWNTFPAKGFSELQNEFKVSETCLSICESVSSQLYMATEGLLLYNGFVVFYPIKLRLKSLIHSPLKETLL